MKPKSLEVFNEETNVNFYCWQIIIQGFFQSRLLRKYLHLTPGAQTAHLEKDHGRSAIEVEGWLKIGKYLMVQLNQQKLSLSQLIKDHQILGERIFTLYKTIDSQDLGKVKNKEFLAWFQKLWPDFMDLNGIGLVPVASDYYHSYLSIELGEILKKRNLTDVKRQEYLNLLMSPDRANIAWQEQLDLLTLVHKFQSVEKLRKSQEFINHLKKYEWLNYGYQGPQVKAEDFIARANKLLRQRSELRKELLNHRNYFKSLVSRQRQVEKTLKLTAKEKYLFEAARVFTYLKGYRIDTRHYFHFICDRMFSELGKRFNLPIVWFHYAERTEITALLQGKRVSRKEILNRSRKMLWYIEEGKSGKFIKPSQIPSFYDKYVHQEEVREAAEVMGQPAFLGKVRGKARIVFSVNHITKVEHGDILIAITTNPDLLPAMYRANAFVTDTGGITSHAAIVAREMKKPCVIGTKFATKIFKDGDMIEVDANKGIVRKV